MRSDAIEVFTRTMPIVNFQIATFGPTKLLKVLQECGVHALPNRIMFVYRVQNSESAELLGRLCGCDT
jgi:hypothetical protein